MTTSQIRSLRLQSTATGISAGDLEAIAHGITKSLHDVARAWGEYVWHLVDAAGNTGFHIRVTDDLDIDGALGYHDLDPSGAPIAYIGARACDQADIALSSVIDHEVKELVGDPAANLWATDAHGTSWARELCDAVEGDSYTEPVTGIALSNWLLPAYFNPLAQRGPFDHLGNIEAPFTVAPNGYAIRLKGGRIDQVWGHDVPRTRRAITGGRVRARRQWVTGEA